MADRVTAKLRKSVAERSQGYCPDCYCPDCFSPQPFSVDYIFPKSLGGETILENLALICQGCNNHKYDKVEAIDQELKQYASLYHPRKQLWIDHFVWSAYFRLVIGITPTGRATIEALKLNRDRVLNLRRVLSAMGEHPPN